MKPQDAWNATYHQLELQLDRASFETWLRRATFLGEEQGVFVVGVQNSYARDYLQYRLYRNIQNVLSDIRGVNTELRFEVSRDEAVATPVTPQDEEMPLFKMMAQQQAIRLINDELDRRVDVRDPSVQEIVSGNHDFTDYELNPRYTFERFVVNKSNNVAYEAARAVVEQPANMYNPFLVYSNVGLGKTHLLQAMAHVFNRRGMKTLYISSEAFTNDLISAIRSRTTAMFRDKYRSVDVLIVDDIQFIAGKETTQEEFFHTFNTLVSFNKQVILASDRHPRDMATLDDRLRSRFQGGLVVDIQEPEYETRIAILRMWASEQNVELSTDVVEMIARRAPKSIRELEGVYNQLSAQVRLGGQQALSTASAEKTLTRFSQPRDRVTIDRIIEVTARHHNLTADDLTSKRRASRINAARQVAMYLAREMTDSSLPQIGDAFGGRAHTTVLHGANKVVEEMASDRMLEAKIKRIQRDIQRGE